MRRVAKLTASACDRSNRERRMREIRTSGATRGGGVTLVTSPLLYWLPLIRRARLTATRGAKYTPCLRLGRLTQW